MAKPACSCSADLADLLTLRLALSHCAGKQVRYHSPWRTRRRSTARSLSHTRREILWRTRQVQHFPAQSAPADITTSTSQYTSPGRTCQSRFATHGSYFSGNLLFVFLFSDTDVCSSVHTPEDFGAGQLRPLIFDDASHSPLWRGRVRRSSEDVISQSCGGWRLWGISELV